MTTIAELYDGLKARLQTVPGVNVYDTVAGSAEWPAAILMAPAVEYEGLDLGDQDLRFEVVVLVGAQDDRQQLRLLPYMALVGAESIPAAIQANRSLGLPDGDVDAFVARSRPLGLQEQASYQGWGAAFEVMVRLG